MKITVLMFVKFEFLLGIIIGISGQEIRRSAARRNQALEELQNRLDQMTSNSDSVPAGPQQTAKYCRVSSEDLLATAEATAKGVLQGVCNPREIEDRLHNIESQIADQFTIVKTMVLNVEEKMASQESSVKKYLKKIQSSIDEVQSACARGPGKGGLKTLTRPSAQGQSSQSYPAPSVGAGSSGRPLKSVATSSSDAASTTNASSNIQGKPGPSSPNLNKQSTLQTVDSDFEVDDDELEEEESEAPPNPRLLEIEKINNTIHVENGKRVFTFFWKVGDMEYKLNNWGTKRSLRSNSFFIFQYGYMMYMRMYPRQNGQNVYMHVGLTKGEFDEALEWPFTLKHRVTILDQSHSSVDIMSRIWDPQVLCSEWNWKRPQNTPNNDNYECVGLGLPHADIKSRNYVENNSIVMKLTVFLDPIFS